MLNPKCCLHRCNLTRPQLQSLSKGGSIIVKQNQFADDGEHAIRAMPSTTNKIRKGKNFRLTLKSKCEGICDPITGEGLDWGKMFHRAKDLVTKGARKVYNCVDDETKNRVIRTALDKGHNVLNNVITKADEKLKGNKYYDSIPAEAKAHLGEQLHDTGQNLAVQGIQHIEKHLPEGPG